MYLFHSSRGDLVLHVPDARIVQVHEPEVVFSLGPVLPGLLFLNSVGVCVKHLMAAALVQKLGLQRVRHELGWLQQSVARARDLASCDIRIVK